MSTVPKLPLFAREAIKELKSLEGEEYLLYAPYTLPKLKKTYTSRFSPSHLCETLVAGVMENLRPTVVKVEKEPNGRDTFPDIRVTFSNGAIQDFEVKSWCSDKREWSAARITAFNKAILAGDAKYFTTPYLDFDLTENRITETAYMRKVSIGRIFDFSDAKSLMASRSSFRSTGMTSPGEFMVNAARGDGNLLEAGAMTLARIGFIEHKEEGVLLEEARRLMSK